MVDISKIRKKCGKNAKIVLDAPLLIESKYQDFVDKVIVVKASKEDMIGRLSKRYSKKKIKKIIKMQLPIEQKLKHADFIIENNKDLSNLENQVKIIIKKLNNATKSKV